MRYLRERRAALGGALPRRRADGATGRRAAARALCAASRSTPTARRCRRRWPRCACWAACSRTTTLGPRIVPIVADEARTFGMANLFRQIGIYSPVGQLYEPEDAGSMLYYREARDGQLLEEGITEAGAMSSWTAAATSYSVHGLPMLPFYIYYSMFGFQRVGDLIWAAADQRARGFLLGATAGRTTLGGEGLQHQDGSSHVMAATVPNCRAYDPAFACELAVILDHGDAPHAGAAGDEFYYVTVMNENYAQPSLPDGAADGDRARHVPARDARRRSRRRAPARLRRDPARGARGRARCSRRLERRQRGVQRDELQRARARRARGRAAGTGCIPRDRRGAATSTRCLAGDAPVVAATDYVRAYPQLIAAYVARAVHRARHRRLRPQRHARGAAPLLRGRPPARRGRRAAQRSRDEGGLERKVVADAIARYRLDADRMAPWKPDARASRAAG